MKKAGKFAVIVVIAIVLYVVLGAILPFVRQPGISEETKKAAGQKTFFGEGFSGERVCILSDNGEALAERIRLISQAEHRIALSTFDFQSMESGKDLLAALCAAAERGVIVEVLVDGVSGLVRMEGDPYFKALSGLENAQIKIYNPINPMVPWRLMGRLHDKYLMVDDTAYVMGGRNNYDFFLGDYGGHINYDWDVLIYNSGDGMGESMEQLERYFESVWELPLCRLYHDGEKELEKPAVRKAARELEQRYISMQKQHSDWFERCDYLEKTMPVHHIELISGMTDCYAKEPVVFYEMTELMGQAKEEVCFHTPYIICDDWMMERLEKICENVPRVVMMTNSVANNGNPFGAMDYQKNREKILDTGLEILEYDGGVSYHGKCFVMDDRITGIGSFNWDMRSAYIDTELMLVIDSEEVNAGMRSEMKKYEEKALTVIDAQSSVAPEGMTPQKLSLLNRIIYAVMRIVGGWVRFLM